MNPSAHHFFIYVPNISQQFALRRHVTFKDALLWQRLVGVLHMRAGQELTLFDATASHHVRITAAMLAKKRICSFELITTTVSQPLQPPLTLGIGLLKKQNLEEVACLAGALGVTRLVPVITGRSRIEPPSEKEYARLCKAGIAGCEQAQQPTLPSIDQPVSLDAFVQNVSSHDAHKVVLHPGGQPLVATLQSLQTSPKQIIIFIGPEAGLAHDEVETLKRGGFVATRLTPTTLRSVEAVAIGVGAVRSV